ncbi:MAG: cytochrome c oxidase assembly protein [Actinomycetota bacterium]|nr:cytochrome c oxidase assembly protein [Actinomycetota bacterium]
MLIAVLAHATVSSSNAATPWYGEASVILVVGVVATLYVRGRRRAPRGRRRKGADLAFAAGSVSTIAALSSPLDAFSTELASAHMVQHVVLMLVAAPLFAWSTPLPPIARGLPRSAVVRFGSAARVAGAFRRRREAFVTPALVTMAHVGSLWAWHIPLLYDAAIRSQGVHTLEHASFFVGAVLFWGMVVFPRRRSAASGGRLLILFGLAMQSVFLGVLLTFASSPWYASYASTTRAWGLTALEDQQLAGAIMWVPAGAVYVGVAIAVVAAWLNDAAAVASPVDRSPSRVRDRRAPDPTSTPRSQRRR